MPYENEDIYCLSIVHFFNICMLVFDKKANTFFALGCKYLNIWKLGYK
jgi:hypothetical protein